MPPLTMNMHEIRATGKGKSRCTLYGASPAVSIAVLFFYNNSVSNGRTKGATALKHFIRSFISHEEP